MTAVCVTSWPFDVSTTNERLDEELVGEATVGVVEVLV
jgi:hypothetical protein